ncbi:MAG TPA: DUF2497 domain-containing protein [Acidocella sp.]|jgi:cell pole-organizing protein PopZ|uniref:DUF2497 domain-containing protein n=1 Tax=Acidocella sp. TaxID=50710 RepID=UPI002C33DABE|nr:DUF2497 domain-containing protein [Acidocella sp.]HVE21116.1 DUF2497 domain-containing protein [Acidocella sp.]
MDEVLASIRRILKEDEQQEETASTADAEDEILVLSAEMEAKPEEVSVPLESEAIPPSSPRNETEMEQAMDEHGQNKAGLVSDMATAEITSALGSLVRGVSQDRSVAVSRGGVTLEEMVREEIRPVLKAWLDANLPGLVERVVRAEIERVIDRTKL